MIKRAALIAVICLLLAPTPAAAAEEGVIQGQVINMTPGGGLVAELTVTLYTYLNNAEVATTSTTTNSEGMFEFSDLETESNYSYQVELIYQEAEYYSDMIQFGEGETSESIELDVYDATTSDEAISAHAWYMMIYVERGGFSVLEDFILANRGDRTYIGSEVDGERETLTFSLPQGFSDAELSMGLMACCAMVTEAGIVDSMPFEPGMKEIVFNYRVGYTPPTYTFSRIVDYPVDTFLLFVEDPAGIQVTSEQLTSEGSAVAEDGTILLQFSGQALDRDTILNIRISGLPMAGYQEAFKWAGFGLMGLAFSFFLGYAMLRRKPQAVTIDQRASQSEVSELLLEIAELDDDFEAGRITEEEYGRLRSQKKAQLIVMDRGWKRNEGES